MKFSHKKSSLKKDNMILNVSKDNNADKSLSWNEKLNLLVAFFSLASSIILGIAGFNVSKAALDITNTQNEPYWVVSDYNLSRSSTEETTIIRNNGGKINNCSLEIEDVLYLTLCDNDYNEILKIQIPVFLSEENPHVINYDYNSNSFTVSRKSTSLYDLSNKLNYLLIPKIKSIKNISHPFLHCYPNIRINYCDYKNISQKKDYTLSGYENELLPFPKFKNYITMPKVFTFSQENNNNKYFETVSNEIYAFCKNQLTQ